MLFASANLMSMNCPSAPESMRASVETIFCFVLTWMGIRIVELLLSDTSTGEIARGGRSVSLGLLIKNPPFLFHQRFLPSDCQVVGPRDDECWQQC